MQNIFRTRYFSHYHKQKVWRENAHNHTQWYEWKIGVGGGQGVGEEDFSSLTNTNKRDRKFSISRRVFISFLRDIRRERRKICETYQVLIKLTIVFKLISSRVIKHNKFQEEIENRKY